MTFLLPLHKEDGYKLIDFIIFVYKQIYYSFFLHLRIYLEILTNSCKYTLKEN